jgi:tetratricopeptide (TPR) repeat protein
MPFRVEGAPHVVNALESDRGDWRNYYRDRYFADLHGFTVMSTLKEYKTDNLRIKEAIKLRLDGEWKESLNSLGAQVVDPDNPFIGEALYISGLVYESLAFFPEAMGNYARLEFTKEEAGGEFYYKTILRKSYVKFLTGLKYSRLLSMIDADGGFYKVFNNSTDDIDWRDALAGHAVMLYFFGSHDHAELIFKQIAEYGPLRPAYQLARAENYMSLGLHQNARVAFQDLLVAINDSKRHDLLAYMYLRLGDIANIRGESDNAKAFYEQIVPLPDEQDGEIVYNEPYIMQAMAVGEYYMKAEKNADAIGIFRVITNGPFPIGLDLRETVALNLVLLYIRDSQTSEAFVRAKEFTLLYPKNPYIRKVWEIINDHIYSIISEGTEKHDYNNVLYYYFENVGFIKEKRTLIPASIVLMDMGFPYEANQIFLSLWEKNPSYSDISVVTGLAKSTLMLENREKAREFLKKARASNKADRVKLAETWRLLGDEFHRKGEIEGAIVSYANARKEIKDNNLDLTYANLLTLSLQGKKAVDIYKSLLKRSLTDEFIVKVYMGFAECYFSIRDWRRALTNYHFALRSAPKSELGKIYYKIGEINLALGKESLAVEAWKHAVDTDEQGYFKKLARGRLREVQIWKPTRM